MDAHQSVAEKTMSFLGAENTIADSSLDNSVSFLLNRIAGKPLVVALVGLPGRGKTIISTKLKRLLTWNKIVCEVSGIFPNTLTNTFLFEKDFGN